jgi:hypothetical protein
MNKEERKQLLETKLKEKNYTIGERTGRKAVIICNACKTQIGIDSKFIIDHEAPDCFICKDLAAKRNEESDEEFKEETYLEFIETLKLKKLAKLSKQAKKGKFEDIYKYLSSTSWLNYYSLLIPNVDEEPWKTQPILTAVIESNIQGVDLDGIYVILADNSKERTTYKVGRAIAEDDTNEKNHGKITNAVDWDGEPINLAKIIYSLGSKEEKISPIYKIKISLDQITKMDEKQLTKVIKMLRILEYNVDDEDITSHSDLVRVVIQALRK